TGPPHTNRRKKAQFQRQSFAWHRPRPTAAAGWWIRGLPSLPLVGKGRKTRWQERKPVDVTQRPGGGKTPPRAKTPSRYAMVLPCCRKPRVEKPSGTASFLPERRRSCHSLLVNSLKPHGFPQRAGGRAALIPLHMGLVRIDFFMSLTSIRIGHGGVAP